MNVNPTLAKYASLDTAPCAYSGRTVGDSGTVPTPFVLSALRSKVYRSMNGVAITKHCGFTLIEVLVALLILAVTMAAVSRTASSSIHHVEVLRTHVIADWVAQNRLALHQARNDWPAPGIKTGEEIQAGQTYPWQEEIIATPNPTMRRIVVSVYEPDDVKHSLRELTGYLVQYPR